MTSYAYDALRDPATDPRQRTAQPDIVRSDGSRASAGAVLDVWATRERAAREDRRKYEGIWRLCEAFAGGRQWVGLTKSRDARVVEEPNPRKRERHTANVLTQYFWTAIGKLYDPTRPDALFARPDFEAQKFTEQINQALDYAWEEEIEAPQAIRDILINVVGYGTSGAVCGYNNGRGPYLGEVPVDDEGRIIHPDEQDPRYEELMKKMAFGEPIDWRVMREGRIEWRTLSPFALLPPPAIEHERNFPWIITEEAVLLDDAKAAFGERAAELTEETITKVGQIGVDGDGWGGSKLKGHVLLKCGRERPSRDFPDGRIAYWAQDTLLQERERLPYIVNGEPKAGIVFFRYHQVPGRWWGQGLIEPGIGPQRQRNRARSQHIEMKDKNLGRVYAKKGALTEANTPVGKIMELIEVKQSVSPTSDIVETQGVPPGPWISEEKAMNDEDLEKIMGFRDLVNSESMRGVTAYSAFALQAEQEDKRVGPILLDFRGGLVELSKFTACAIRKYWSTDKQIVIAGPDKTIQAFVFNGAKMPENVYFRYPLGASRPKSAAAEIQKVFDIYDRSVSSGRPLGMEWLMNSLDAGKALPFPQNQVELQKEKAQLENMLAAQGQAPVLSPLDDHLTHIPEHQLAVQQAILAGNPQVAQALQIHIAEHQQAMQSQQQLATAVPGMQGDMGALGAPQAQAANAGVGQAAGLLASGMTPAGPSA